MLTDFTMSSNISLSRLLQVGSTKVFGFFEEKKFRHFQANLFDCCKIIPRSKAKRNISIRNKKILLEYIENRFQVLVHYTSSIFTVHISILPAICSSCDSNKTTWFDLCKDTYWDPKIKYIYLKSYFPPKTGNEQYLITCEDLLLASGFHSTLHYVPWIIIKALPRF